MRKRTVSSLLALLLCGTVGLGVYGCKSRAQTASERLRDSVVGYNDELRFGRQDLALQRVAPAHRGAFIGGHYRWGRGVEVADVEIVNVEATGEEAHHAVSFVTIRWIATGTMIVRETLLRQEWSKHGGYYVLDDEMVIDGDESLLAVPEGFRAQTSGLVAASPDGGVPDGAVIEAAATEAAAP